MPFSFTLHRNSIYLALILAFWGAVKVGWEDQLQRNRDALRFQGIKMNRELRDQLSQGTTIALLSGFRGVVADFCWLSVTTAWENKEWFRVKNRIELTTSLQPRSPLFWEMGGWHLAWNASVDARYNQKEPLEIRRIKEERYWIDAGRDLFLRGAENNPERYNLWLQLAWVYDQKKKDYLQAAHYFGIAAERPNAPTYLERFVGYSLEKGGDYAGAYEQWKKIWFSTPKHDDPLRRWEKIEGKIRDCEARLKVPREKRVFAN